MERYLKWFKEGYLSSNGICFDIGITTLSSLMKFKETREPYCGPTDEYTAGNGSLMRLVPVPLFAFLCSFIAFLHAYFPAYLHFARLNESLLLTTILYYYIDLLSQLYAFKPASTINNNE